MFNDDLIDFWVLVNLGKIDNIVVHIPQIDKRMPYLNSATLKTYKSVVFTKKQQFEKIAKSGGTNCTSTLSLSLFLHTILKFQH